MRRDESFHQLWEAGKERGCGTPSAASRISRCRAGTTEATTATRAGRPRRATRGSRTSKSAKGRRPGQGGRPFFASGRLTVCGARPARVGMPSAVGGERQLVDDQRDTHRDHSRQRPGDEEKHDHGGAADAGHAQQVQVLRHPAAGAGVGRREVGRDAEQPSPSRSPIASSHWRPPGEERGDGDDDPCDRYPHEETIEARDGRREHRAGHRGSALGLDRVEGRLFKAHLDDAGPANASSAPRPSQRAVRQR